MHIYNKFQQKDLTVEHLCANINSVTIENQKGVLFLKNSSKKKRGSAHCFEFPTEEEIQQAQLVCCARNCRRCETPTEYAWRKREVDLTALTREAIEAELSEKEKAAVYSCWFELRPVHDFARENSISRQAASQTLLRAEEKLKRALKYVVMYRQNTWEREVIPLFVRRALAVTAVESLSCGGIGGRVLCLRQGEGISVSKLADILGMEEKRLLRIENGSQNPNVNELVAFAGFFKTSTDFLLVGHQGLVGHQSTGS